MMAHLVAYDQGFMIMEVEPMDILKKTLKMSASNKNEVMSVKMRSGRLQNKNNNNKILNC